MTEQRSPGGDMVRQSRESTVDEPLTSILMRGLIEGFGKKP